MGRFSKISVTEKPYRHYIIDPRTGLKIQQAGTGENGNDPVYAYIDLFSANSSRSVKFRSESFNELKRKQKRGSRDDDTLEDAMEKQARFLASLTAGWLLLDFEGEVLEDSEFSHDTAVELYSATSMEWLRRQVDEVVQDEALFLPASSTS